MADYKLTDSDTVIRTSDGTAFNPDHRLYVEFVTWKDAGGVPDPYIEAPLPDVGALVPRMIASALNVNVAAGDIAGVQGIFGLAGAIYLDVGLYMLLFIDPQPDTDFYAIINGGAPCMATAEKGVDYLMIQATDSAGGAPVDPAQFNVQIFRA